MYRGCAPRLVFEPLWNGTLAIKPLFAKDVAILSGMIHAELLEKIDALEARIPKIPYRIVPTSFDPEDPELRGFPIPLKWRWASCEEALRVFGATGVMMRLPLFWQLESPLWSACKKAGAFIFTNDPENMPLGAAAIRSANIDCVVTETKDASLFSDFLREKKYQLPRSWIIIHPANSDEWSLPKLEGANVAQEVHLFPGIPLLEQCANLRAKQRPRFHINSSYMWDTSLGEITGNTDDPLPLIGYRIPFPLKEEGACSCGRRIVARVG